MKKNISCKKYIMEKLHNGKGTQWKCSISMEKFHKHGEVSKYDKVP